MVQQPQSTVSYPSNEWVMVKGCVQWNHAFVVGKNFASSGIQTWA